MGRPFGRMEDKSLRQGDGTARPHCPVHPGWPLFVHRRRWAWLCPVEQAERQATPQPYQVVAGRHVSVPLPAVENAAEQRALDAAMWTVRVWGERQGFA